MSSRSFFRPSQPHRKVRRANRRNPGRRPRFEEIEDRRMLTFSPLVNYDVGQSPQAIVSADFNNDHILDLAVADYSSSTVSVLLGNANGSFQPALTSSTGANPVSLAVGDFDGDHILDLAVAGGYSYYGDVSVLLGNDNGSGAGTGTFAAPTSVGIGSTPTSVAVGDFNGDGKLDLGVTSNSYYYYYGSYGQANVLLGSGDGSFSGPNSTPLGFGYFTSAAVGRFDGDNIDDFATVNYYYGTVGVLVGDSSGYLQGPSDFYAGN